MGTTYPTGQGAKFSNLHKFDPGYSVGENYDWQSVDAWIKSQGTKVKTTGHSQGGSSAMFIAATYPEYISQADCLNPPALCTSTLNRLNPKWLDIPENDRPCVNVYAQEGDIVYQLENGFLSGTKIFQISSDVDKCSNLNPLLPQFFQKILESHLHHFVGRERSTITQLDAKQESFTHKREFFGDMKAATNWVLFPFFYSDLVMGFALRNTSHWCLEHLPKALTLPIAIVGFIPYHALKYALNLSLLLVKTCLLVSTLLLTAFISGMKIGMCSAFGISYSPEDNKNINPSPVAVPM